MAVLSPAETTDRTRTAPRRYANPLPLGFFSFAVGMGLIGGMGLGWLSAPQDVRTAGVLMAAFVFPLELVAAVFAMLARNTGAATALGLFATSWVALGLTDILAPAQQTSRAVGIFVAAFAVMLVPIAVRSVFVARLQAAVLAVSTVRAALQAGYELGAPHWVDTADGVAALVLLMLAVLAGTVFLTEDLRHR